MHAVVIIEYTTFKVTKLIGTGQRLVECFDQSVKHQMRLSQAGR